MNQRLLGRSNGGFTTAMVLRIDDDGTLTIANAGHLARYNNGREVSVENGLPLGLVSDVGYEESRLHLAPSDTLTLLSDGVVEAQSVSGELFGFERAAAISHEPAEKVAQAARAFGQQDDITVVTLTLEPAAVLQA
jgi:serine phosphatase RsbU (regulator of sigma subunit)